ncbi:unnamed protein product [Diatraea saccharalis]|uniref:Uncharacterized protein n=1 Tax=Diatraea saccharalis TaxID=40085 RepID=A0A9N9QTT3_9NEOP|nr:unnamed protein product [Diatraea saccharalis]
MPSGLKNLKIIRMLLRPRSTLAPEISEVFQPTLSRKKEMLIELIKEKIELTRKSKIAKKLQTAKGFYTLEMAPPSSQNEMQINHLDNKGLPYMTGVALNSLLGKDRDSISP